MRKTLYVIFLLCLSMLAVAQSQPQGNKKTRNVAKTDATSVNHRKISVQYTEGLKAYYSGNMSEALKIFNGILLDNPKHDASHFMLARIYTDKQDVREAVDNLQKAIKLDKNNIWYKVDLADLYLQMEDYPNAAKLLEQICKEKTNNEYYLYSLAEAYLAMKKFDKVVDAYDRMENIIGHNDELTRVKVSIWLYMNKVKEAVGEYDKLIKLYPHNVEYYVKAGKVYQSNGMAAQAMSYFEKAAELNSNDPELNFLMAQHWEQQGNVEKQMQCLMRVFSNRNVAMSEKSNYMRKVLGDVLRTKDPKTIRLAEVLTDTLIAAHPDESIGYASKATLCSMQKKYNDAATFFEKSLAIDNTSFPIWDDYCYVLNQLDAWDRLVKYEKDLNELFPQNARMLCNLGLGFLFQKNADKAIEYLMQAKTFAYEKDQLNVIYSALSEAYKLKGDNAAAEQWRAKAGK
ncbi:MAG: tetratricopeptide repeat protein [Bacteroidales bacterium]|nr:tetratricopeptide repeat protein [Bacteroidales bacterium]